MAGYTTFRGKSVDLNKFIAKHGDTVALGNASMNARGDKVDRFGKVIKPREVISQEYNASNPKAVRRVSVKNLTAETMRGSVADAVTPAQALQRAAAPKQVSGPQASNNQASNNQASNNQAGNTPPVVETPAPSPKRKITDSEN